MIYKNPLAKYPDATAKHLLYSNDCQLNMMAQRSDDTLVPLCDVAEHTVEYIGGLWRVQDDCDYEINTIRKRLIVLGTRIPHNEKTFFEYYRAAFVGFNCYGPIIDEFNMIVAKYTTNRGIFWAYGKTIADARAYLGIKLYDEFQDLIHAVAARPQMQKN